jgi:hypothetical protein
MPDSADSVRRFPPVVLLLSRRAVVLESLLNRVPEKVWSEIARHSGGQRHPFSELPKQFDELVASLWPTIEN